LIEINRRRTVGGYRNCRGAGASELDPAQAFPVHVEAEDAALSSSKGA
jgi:hypothetical protein